jgi:hypothetical protein
VELLRIVSEALTNVRKHADATMVRIHAEVSRSELVIRVTDNGRGFVQEEAFDQGMGLRGMRERARLIGGSLLVMSELSGGTTIEVRTPLVTRGVASIPETDERTLMAPDSDVPVEELALGLPEAFADLGVPAPAGPVGGSRPTMRGSGGGPDATATSVQP